MSKNIIFSEDLKSHIKDLYAIQNVGLENISKKIGISRKVIKNMLISEGVAIKSTSLICRKYDINENFLNDIKESQAYFLGWLATDGSVAVNNEVTLALQDRDLDVLQKIKKLFDFTGPISFHIPKRNLRFKSQRNYYRISLANQNLANRLRDFGFDNNKSYSLKFPTFIKDEYMSHFFRSFIEGDGSIVYSNNNLQVGFVSTKSFCISFKEYIKNKFNINIFLEPIRGISGKNTSKTHLRASVCGNGNCLIFLNYIYKNAEYRMNRKYNYFKNVVSILNGKPRCHSRTKLLLQESNAIISNNK